MVLVCQNHVLCKPHASDYKAQDSKVSSDVLKLTDCLVGPIMIDPLHVIWFDLSTPTHEYLRLHATRLCCKGLSRATK
jgi:hypothetical protein